MFEHLTKADQDHSATSTVEGLVDGTFNLFATPPASVVHFLADNFQLESGRNKKKTGTSWSDYRFRFEGDRKMKLFALILDDGDVPQIDIAPHFLTPKKSFFSWKAPRECVVDVDDWEDLWNGLVVGLRENSLEKAVFFLKEKLLFWLL